MKRIAWAVALILLLTSAVHAETWFIPLVQKPGFTPYPPPTLPPPTACPSPTTPLPSPSLTPLPRPPEVYIEIEGRDYLDDCTYSVWGIVYNQTARDVRDVRMHFKLRHRRGRICFEGVMPIIDYLPAYEQRAFNGQTDTGDSEHCLSGMRWGIHYDIVGDN